MHAADAERAGRPACGVREREWALRVHVEPRENRPRAAAARPAPSSTKGRTLPPASGGAPPPPTGVVPHLLSAVAEGLVSQERLVTTLHDDDVVSDRDPQATDEKKTATA